MTHRIVQQELKRGSLFRQAIAIAGVAAVFSVCLSCSQPSQEPENRPPASESSASKSSSRESSANKSSVDHVPLGPIELGEIASLTDNDFTAIVADEISKVDPSVDGWQTEEFSDSAMVQLKLLGKWLSHPDSHHDEARTTLADENFASRSLRPSDLQTVFEDNVLLVKRSVGQGGEKRGEGSEKSEEDDLLGPQQLARLLRDLRAPFPSEQDVRTKFKIVSVELSDTSATTTVYYQAASGQVSQTATWLCRWISPGSHGFKTDEPPKLLDIEVSSYEETQYHGPDNALFSDCTEGVLAADKSYPEHLSRSLEYWRARLDASLGTGLASYVGFALGDVNGDGLEDLYLCQSGGMPNRLLVQNPNGTVTDRAQQAGVDFLDLSRSALLVDLDNDGDQDLILSSSSKVIFFENQSIGSAVKFTLRETIRTGSEVFSLAAADYDQDGDLDLYTCGYTGSFVVAGQSTALGMPIPYHDANNGGINKLLRNDLSEKKGLQGKTWHFEDVTAESGMDQNNNRFSLAASWEDFDNDGDLDLYVANDFGRNYLYRNDNGQFIDIASTAGVEDLSAGMSVGWADYDHDGWMDLYVSNMFSAAGNRIAYQRKFQADISAGERAQFQRHARGNTLFRSSGDGTFEDVSLPASVTMGRWAWSSNFLDINNDGWEDLFVANGFMTTPDTGDL